MTGLRVLLVDDNAETRRLLSRGLRGEGVEVFPVESVDEAVDLLGYQEVDAIVTDLLLPGRRGDALLVIARAMPRRVPVIVLTGLGSIDGDDWDAVLSKPEDASPRAILDAIRRALA